MKKRNNTQPNFLIVGAAKSGTTSLYHYLKEHPDVFMPDWKEPSFFAPPEAGGVTTEEEYLSLFKNTKNESAIGEASVAYLYTPEAPQKIYDFLGPDVKIIILLRNPVDMAYSNWGHQTREKHENLSFEQALKEETTRLNDPSFQQTLNCWSANLAYLDRVRYAVQISRYKDKFPSENIKTFIYEEFFKEGLPHWNELCDFLEISSNYKPDIRIHNAAGKSRSPFFQAILQKRMAWKEPIKAILPLKWRQEIRRRLESINHVHQKLPPMASETRKTLEDDLKDDVLCLEECLNKSLKNVWF